MVKTLFKITLNDSISLLKNIIDIDTILKENGWDTNNDLVLLNPAGAFETLYHSEGELREASNRRLRRQAQQSLVESQARFQRVWEATSDALALSDSEGLVLAANPAFLELCGWEIAALYRLAVELDQNQLFCQLQRHQQIRNGCPRFDVPGLSVQVKLHTERTAESQSFQTGSRPFALSAAAISSGDR